MGWEIDEPERLINVIYVTEIFTTYIEPEA